MHRGNEQSDYNEKLPWKLLIAQCNATHSLGESDRESRKIGVEEPSLSGSEKMCDERGSTRRILAFACVYLTSACRLSLKVIVKIIPSHEINTGRE